MTLNSGLITVLIVIANSHSKHTEYSISNNYRVPQILSNADNFINIYLDF